MDGAVISSIYRWPRTRSPVLACRCTAHSQPEVSQSSDSCSIRRYPAGTEQLFELALPRGDVFWVAHNLGTGWCATGRFGPPETARAIVMVPSPSVPRARPLSAVPGVSIATQAAHVVPRPLRSATPDDHGRRPQ